MTELFQVKDGKAQLFLHEGQLRAWESDRRFVIVMAGTQGGKTSFGPWWLRREILKNGPGDYLAVTSSYDLFKLKMLPEIIKVFEDVLDIGRLWVGDKVLELRPSPSVPYKANKSSDPMWGRVILRSASAKGGLESATAKAAWLDELGQDEFSLSAWEAVLRRLSLSGGRILGTTTLYNVGWLKRQVYDLWEHGDSEIDVINFPSTQNPSFPKNEFEAMRSKMPGWKFRMFYEGLYARPAGLIYNDFVDKPREQGGHLVEPFDVPQEWPRFVGVDPGAVNTAVIWVAHDIQHNVFFVYRESLEGGLSTREHATKALNAKGLDNVVRWSIGAKSEEQQRMDWNQNGVPAQPPPVHDVESGIDFVIQLLREHRLFFFDDLNQILDEVATYSRQLDDNGEPTEKIKDKERYHLLDALRYNLLGTGEVYEDAGAIVRPQQRRIANWY